MRNKVAVLLAVAFLTGIINAQSTIAGYNGLGYTVWYYLAGAAFINNSTSISYNITALAQNNSEGLGSLDSVIGTEPSGYVYSAGLGYNLLQNVSNTPPFKFTYYPGFEAVLTVAMPDGGFAPESFTTSFDANPGDKILISMKVENGNVEMLVKDWDNGASENLTYVSFGNSFTGMRAGNFTSGSLTEWQGVLGGFYAANELASVSPTTTQRVAYTPYNMAAGPAVLVERVLHCVDSMFCSPTSENISVLESNAITPSRGIVSLNNSVMYASYNVSMLETVLLANGVNSINNSQITSEIGSVTANIRSSSIFIALVMLPVGAVLLILGLILFLMVPKERGFIRVLCLVMAVIGALVCVAGLIILVLGLSANSIVNHIAVG